MNKIGENPSKIMSWAKERQDALKQLCHCRLTQPQSLLVPSLQQEILNETDNETDNERYTQSDSLLYQTYQLSLLCPNNISPYHSMNTLNVTTNSTAGGLPHQHKNVNKTPKWSTNAPNMCRKSRGFMQKFTTPNNSSKKLWCVKLLPAIPNATTSTPAPM